MFGHGQRNCHIKTFCANCAGHHNTSECDNAAAVKCANCSGNHKSTDPSCISRIKYLQIREKSAVRTPNRHSSPHASPPQAEPTFNSVLKPVSLSSINDFPMLPLPHKRRVDVPNKSCANSSSHMPNPSPTHIAWDSHSSLTQHSTPNATTTSNMVGNNNVDTNVNLFSMYELNALCFEMINSLSVCKTRVDQFNAIARLANKFLYSKSNAK
ncbi:uncharacterized protein LOC129944810 [Eupeodes corollae]|uniref:uncharacterized protein LOC129944810 n=1 Tax=Eupeodes corollae TaxID=290404 RepID=UPI0024924C57|nr:uncharacterized protein LOC129944810 [Eupeodes corollae]